MGSFDLNAAFEKRQEKSKREEEFEKAWAQRAEQARSSNAEGSDSSSMSSKPVIKAASAADLNAMFAAASPSNGAGRSNSKQSSKKVATATMAAGDLNAMFAQAPAGLPVEKHGNSSKPSRKGQGRAESQDQKKLDEYRCCNDMRHQNIRHERSVIETPMLPVICENCGCDLAATRLRAKVGARFVGSATYELKAFGRPIRVSQCMNQHAQKCRCGSGCVCSDELCKCRKSCKCEVVPCGDVRSDIHCPDCDVVLNCCSPALYNADGSEITSLISSEGVGRYDLAFKAHGRYDLQGEYRRAVVANETSLSQAGLIGYIMALTTAPGVVLAINEARQNIELMTEAASGLPLFIGLAMLEDGLLSVDEFLACQDRINDPFWKEIEYKFNLSLVRMKLNGVDVR